LHISTRDSTTHTLLDDASASSTVSIVTSVGDRLPKAQIGGE
jgi:hypothetical protein